MASETYQEETQAPGREGSVPSPPGVRTLAATLPLSSLSTPCFAALSALTVLSAGHVSPLPLCSGAPSTYLSAGGLCCGEAYRAGMEKAVTQS